MRSGKGFSFKSKGLSGNTVGLSRGKGNGLEKDIKDDR